MPYKSRVVSIHIFQENTMNATIRRSTRLCFWATLATLCSLSVASGRLANTTEAVKAGERFLELEIQTVKKNEIHRTHHNGKKHLIGRELTVTCKVITNFCNETPKAGETLVIRVGGISDGFNQDYDENGNLHTLSKAGRFYLNTFGPERSKRSTRFLAVFQGEFHPRPTVWRHYPKPVAMRDIKERAKFIAAIKTRLAGLPKPALTQHSPWHKSLETTYRGPFVCYCGPARPSMKGGTSLTGIHLFTPAGKFLIAFTLLGEGPAAPGWFSYNGSLTSRGPANPHHAALSQGPLGPNGENDGKQYTLAEGKYTPTKPPAAAIEAMRKRLEFRLRSALPEKKWKLTVTTGISGFTPKVGQDPGFTVSATHKTLRGIRLHPGGPKGHVGQPEKARLKLKLYPKGCALKKLPINCYTSEWGQSLEYRIRADIDMGPPSKKREIEHAIRKGLNAHWREANSAWWVKSWIDWRQHDRSPKKLYAWTTILNTSPETVAIWAKRDKTIEVYVGQEQCQPPKGFGEHMHYRYGGALSPGQGAFFAFHLGGWVIPSTGKTIDDSPDAGAIRIIIKPYIKPLPAGMNPRDRKKIQTLTPPEKPITLHTRLMPLPPK
jgi:hypothetical protein